MTIKFVVGGEDVILQPGDQCILPTGDVVAYLTGEQAKAHKLLLAAHQKRTCETIDFIKKKYNIIED
jgi:uncharacterized cupin superfamily protein